MSTTNSRSPLEAFGRYAARPPALWQQVVALALAILLPLALWERRGPLVGLLAALVYSGLFLVAAFGHGALLSWSRRHVVLDALLIVPIAFLGLAYLTRLPLAACTAIAAAAAALLVPLALRRPGPGA